MARERDNAQYRSGTPYQTNGAAAYDIINRLPTYGTAAPKLPEPQRRPHRRPRRRPKAKLAVAPLSVVGLVAAACMLVFVLCGYVQLFEETAQVEELSQELSNVQTYNERLQSVYEDKIDIDVIQDKAARLGMTVPNSKQTVYLNLAGVDRAVITGGTGNIFETIWTGIVRSIHTLMEYFG